MKICLSISPLTMSEALRKLHSSGKFADVIEIRAERLSDIDVKRLLRMPRPKVIITYRSIIDKGKTELYRQTDLLISAMKYGAEYIDIDKSMPVKIIKNILRNRGKSKIIISHHDFHKTPRNLFHIYSSIASLKPDIIKITTTAKDISDNRVIFNLLQRTARYKRPLIAHCMGQRGQVSRILGGKFGSYLTYGSLDSDSRTASGQLELKELNNIYRVSSIDKKTKIFGLVGNPVAHSRGFIFHNNIFRRHKSNAVYVNFLVDDLKSFIKSYRDILSGFSVTMPFKQEIVRFLEPGEDIIESLKAVNTVIVRRHKMIGFNTDFTAMDSIIKIIVSPRKNKISVLGTGAMARTIACASLHNRADVTIIGRSIDKVNSLASEMNCAGAVFNDLPYIKSDIIINATSVGMPGSTKFRLVPKNYLKKDMTVFDAVQCKDLTQLLTEAKNAGCRIITGDVLFKRQAYIQSKLFLSNM